MNDTFMWNEKYVWITKLSEAAWVLASFRRTCDAATNMGSTYMLLLQLEYAVWGSWLAFFLKGKPTQGNS